jgi:hypothetical protein
MSPNVTQGEVGSKKCHVLFEWPLRVSLIYIRLGLGLVKIE